MTSLYHLRSACAGSYRITKLDADYSIEASYLVSKHECNCPAGIRPTCRHRQMLPFFLAKAHIDNGWMLDWHTRQWRKPLCEDQGTTFIDEASEVPEGAWGELAPRSQEDLAPTAERSQDQIEPEDNWAGITCRGGALAQPIEEPVPPAASSLEAEVERPRGPAPAPSASPSAMKRRKI